MIVEDFMQGKIPDPEFIGFSTADDQVFAVDFSGTATDVNAFVVACDGVTEASGSLEAQTADSTYLHVGKVTTKTGTSRTFSISGDRKHGEAFQDALLAHKLKFGTGQAVIRPYVYFDGLTGEGERGTIAITVEDDYAGEAGGNASFSATATSTALPIEFTYTPPAP